VLTTILDNDKYRACVLQSSSSLELFAWMRLYLRSLLLLPVKEGQADQGKVRRVFEDAFKRVIHFLVETMQQGQVQLECRALYFSQAAMILQYFIKLEDADEMDVVEESATIAAQTATLHASLLANFALRGKVPNTMELIVAKTEGRKCAFDVIQAIFEMDCHHLSTNMLCLSKLAIDQRLSLKKAQKQKSAMSDSTYNATLDVLFRDAAKDMDFSPWISSDLWRESYNAFRASDNIALFLQPLSCLSTFVQPELDSHLLKIKSPYDERPSFVQYKDRLRSCLVSFTRRLRSMRGNLPQVLLDISDENGTGLSSSESLSTMCYNLADEIIQANLCPEVDIHKAAQNVVRSTFEDAESRGDCFRAVIQCNPPLALKGIKTYLESFSYAASTLVEANDAAKWMVRSFSDVLEIMCSPTDGLLRVGTPHSLLDNTRLHQHVKYYMPFIWQLMCQSIGVIFKRTPSWSMIVTHEELKAWFRDVLIFASELVDHFDVIQEAATINLGSKEADEVQNNMFNDLAIPLEEASSWFRMNDDEIVHDTKDFFVKGLLCYKGKNQLPSSVKQRMLTFIDGESKIEDEKLRRTRLTLTELSTLRHHLDPRSIIEIEDSDEEEDDAPALNRLSIKEQPVTPTAERNEKVNVVDRKSLEASVVASSKAEEQRKLTQQKLSFQTLDSGSSRPFISKPAPPKPPAPRFAAPSTGSNRYQSATARPTSSTSAPYGSSRLPKATSSAFAEARKNFNAMSRLTHREPYRPSYISSNRELREPQAPGAKRTFTGVALDATNDRNKVETVAEEVSGSSSSGSDDEEAVGLADLVGQKKSPIKMRSKPKMVSKE
jgi:senataxin